MISSNTDPIIKFENILLEEIVKKYVGFHHASLLDNDRKNVENMFKQNKLSVIVSTSTLA